MLSDGEKIQLIIKRNDFSQKKLAKIMGISTSELSQRLTHHGQKPLRKIDILAISKVLNIPSEIFNKNFTESSLEKFLNNNKKKDVVLNKNDLEIMEKLIGKWFIYGYSSAPQLSGEFYKFEIVIDMQQNIKYSLHDIEEGIGKVAFRKHNIMFILYFREEKDEICIFQKEKVIKEIFFSSYKSSSFILYEPIVGFCIISKFELHDKELHKILKSKNETQLLFDKKNLLDLEEVRLKYIQKS